MNTKFISPGHSICKKKHFKIYLQRYFIIVKNAPIIILERLHQKSIVIKGNVL